MKTKFPYDGKIDGGKYLDEYLKREDAVRRIPTEEELRELAGIPKDAPVHVELLDDGEFTVSVNHDGPGLWDVPAPMMKGLLASGICPASLEDLLESGETVYGPEMRRRTADE